MNLDPIEKEVRNPAVVAAFRRIGLSDQAGTGVRSIFGNWRQLGFIPPLIVNNKGEKTFEITLLKETLIDEKQRFFQSRLGARLSDQEAALFAYACRTGSVGVTDAKAIIGRGERESLHILDNLVTQTLLMILEPGVRWGPALHLLDSFTQSGRVSSDGSSLINDDPLVWKPNLVTDQPRKENERADGKS